MLCSAEWMTLISFDKEQDTFFDEQCLLHLRVDPFCSTTSRCFEFLQQIIESVNLLSVIFYKQQISFHLAKCARGNGCKQHL